MIEKERQVIVKALKAIASAFSFCDTDMELALRDRLNTIHEAIEELANDDSAPKNGVSDTEVDVNDAVDKQADSTTQEVDSTTELLSDGTDSREKLEADVLKYYTHTTSTLMWPDDANIKTKWVSVSMDTVLEWLDRQASITEREILSHPDERDEQIAELQQQVDELSERKCPGYDQTRHYCKYHAQDFGLNDRTVSRLKRENSALARDLAECERMREGLRARLSEAIGKASEIAALGDL